MLSRKLQQYSLNDKADKYAFLSTFITIWSCPNELKAFLIISGVLYDGTTINLYLSLVKIVFILLNKKLISLSEKA